MTTFVVEVEVEVEGRGSVSLTLRGQDLAMRDGRGSSSSSRCLNGTIRREEKSLVAPFANDYAVLVEGARRRILEGGAVMAHRACARGGR